MDEPTEPQLDEPPLDEPPIERLFRLWRDTGDGEALAEVLARAEPELFALARRATRDEAAAWDIVQQCWFTVVRDAQRFDATQRLMPWLVGIVQIEVRRARREAARTPDAARVHQPAPEPADREAPAAEARSLVAQALARLPDIYRQVLTLHIIDQLSHGEIAKRTGREASTVRVQVFRGLEQLRKHLPAGLALGTALALVAPRASASHMPAMLASAARMAPVLEAAARSSRTIGPSPRTRRAPSDGSAVPAAVTSASSIVTRWLLVAGAVAVVSVSAWFATRDRTARDDIAAHPARSSTVAHDEGGAASALSAVPVIVQRAAAEFDAPSTTPPSGVWLVAHVSGLPGLEAGEPTLVVRAADAQVPHVIVPVAATESIAVDLSDWYRDGGPAPREFIATLDHPNALPARVPVFLEARELDACRAAVDAGTRREIEIAFDLVRPAARVHGRVELPFGARTVNRIVAGLFELDASRAPAADPVEGLVVNLDGTFALRTAHPGAHIIVAIATGGTLRPANVTMNLAPGEERDLGAIVLDSGATIAGRVILQPGFDEHTSVEVEWRPAAAGATRSLFGVPIAVVDDAFDSAGGRAPVNTGGAFRVEGLAPVGYRLALRFAPAGDAHGESVLDLGIVANTLVVAPAQAVALEADAVTTLRVRAYGEPLEGVLVQHVTPQGLASRARTDARGVVLLQGSAAEVRLVCAKPDYATREIELGRADLGAFRVVDVVLDREPDAALVLDAPGVKWKGAALAVATVATLDERAIEGLRRGEIPREQAGWRTFPIAEDGRVALEVTAGACWIALRAPRNAGEGTLAHALPWARAIEWTPGTGQRVAVQLALGGRIRFAPVARDGEAATADARITLALTALDGHAVTIEVQSLVQRGDARQGLATSVNAMPFGAVATSLPLVPGAYTLRADLGATVVTRNVSIVAGTTTGVELR